MSSLTEKVKQAREDAQLDVATMARIVGLEEERVRAIEAGIRPAPEEIDAYALAFGLTVAGLARGDAARSPISRLLFRAAESERWSAIEALTDTDAQRVFGDFLRAVHHLAELAGDASAPSLPKARGPQPAIG